jgi:uncharacterized protein DUF6894
MPKFYISFLDTGDQLAEDDEGSDFPSLEKAREAALTSAREILADNVKRQTGFPLKAVIIADEGGQQLVTIPAKEILPEPLK